MPHDGGRAMLPLLCTARRGNRKGLRHPSFIRNKGACQAREQGRDDRPQTEAAPVHAHHEAHKAGKVGAHPKAKTPQCFGTVGRPICPSCKWYDPCHEKASQAALL